MRKALFTGVIAAAAAGLIMATALPASAADTTTTFILNNAGGGLSISAPTSASLGTGSVGSATAAGTAFGTFLGSVTVTDTRGQLLASWTATVSSTAFKTGTLTAAETIAASSVTYWSGAATANSGLVAPVPGQLLAANAVALGAAQTAFTHLTGSGNNSATWNPTLTVTPPASSVVGTYSGTVTHSVS